MAKQLKDMVQFCKNSQPIPGQVYPTETTKPAEWYIGRPDSDFRFRFFINEVHVREIIASIPLELRDTDAEIEGVRLRIREEIKAEYEQEIAKLTKTIEHMELEMPDDYDYMEQYAIPSSLMNQMGESGDMALSNEPTNGATEDSKPPLPQVFRCLDDGMDFDTLAELQAHQLKITQEKSKLAERKPNPPTSSKAAAAKRLTPQQRLEQRTGKG